MDTIPAEVIFPNPCELGEGSLWDEQQSLLYWVDIALNKVFVFDPKNRSNLAYDVGENVGTVVLTQNDRLLLALRSGFAWLDPETGQVTRISDPEADRPDTRFNDGKCDPQGRFWAGTMVEGGKPGSGALYCLDTNLVVEKKLDGVTTSNGLVWTRDSRQFYYIDTPTHQVQAFDFDAARGDLHNQRVIAEIPKQWGAPDGMTIDEQDHLWIALFHGSRVVRLDPCTGQFELAVTLPALNVTSCTFGGAELDQLYITTARVGLNREQRQAQPLAGSLFQAKVPIRGVAAHRFARDL